MKTRIILLLSLFALLLALSLFLNFKQYLRTKADAEMIDALVLQKGTQQATIINRYVHDSIEHAVIQEVAAASYGDKANAVGAAYIDTLKSAVRVAEKQLDQVTKVNARLIAENVTLKQQDTGHSYRYQDKWLNLSYNTDSNKLDLQYDIGLNTTRYWKRSWFLAPKRYYLDVFADDPRIKISNVKRYTIAEPLPKRFGIGIHAGYSYSPFRNEWQPSVSFGLQYNLIRF